MPQFWQDYVFAAPFLEPIYISAGDVVQGSAQPMKKDQQHVNMNETSAYVSRRYDTDETKLVTWLRRPIGLIKNLLEGLSAFLMQSQHSGFRQMFYSLCLNINGMWWMLNVFVDIFAQSPVDYARGKCVYMSVCACVCVCMLALFQLTQGLKCVCTGPTVGDSAIQCKICHSCFLGAHVPARTQHTCSGSFLSK